MTRNYARWVFKSFHVILRTSKNIINQQVFVTEMWCVLLEEEITLLTIIKIKFAF
jgi:hypothetical protein